MAPQAPLTFFEPLAAVFSRVGVYLVLVSAALFLGYSIFALFKYTRMISGIFLGLVYNPTTQPFSASRGEKITILDSSDKEVEALFVESRGSRRMVIFCHESGTTKESWERYAYFLPPSGVHVLSIDLENWEGVAERNSLAQWPTRHDVERVLTVIRWAKKAFEPDLRIFLFGVSKGADVVLAASIEDLSVKGVITDGLFSMKEIFRDYIRKWAPILVRPNLFGEKYPGWVVRIFSGLGFWYSQKRSRIQFVDIERLLRKNHPPLLMIHGERDDYVPPTHQHFLERLSGDRKTVHRLVIPDAKHNQAVVLGREVYEQKVLNFLDKL